MGQKYNIDLCAPAAESITSEMHSTSANTAHSQLLVEQDSRRFLPIANASQRLGVIGDPLMVTAATAQDLSRKRGRISPTAVVPAPLRMADESTLLTHVLGGPHSAFQPTIPAKRRKVDGN